MVSVGERRPEASNQAPLAVAVAQAVTRGSHLSGSHSSLCLWLRVASLREPSTSPRPGRAPVLVGAGLALSHVLGQTHRDVPTALPVPPCRTWQACVPRLCQGHCAAGSSLGCPGHLRARRFCPAPSPTRGVWVGLSPQALCSGPAGRVAGMFDFSRLFPTRAGPASLFCGPHASAQELMASDHPNRAAE